MGKKRENRNYLETFKRYFNERLRRVNTITFVRVEDVDHVEREVDVSLKSDSNNIIRDVPIASLWARDGVGIVIPIEDGDEGLLLHPSEPIEKQIQERGEQDPESERRFELEECVFLPMLWLEEDDIPEHEPEELVVEDDHGTRVVLNQDDEGDIEVEHHSGTTFRIDEDGVHIEPELYVDGIAFTTHVHGGVESGGSNTGGPK